MMAKNKNLIEHSWREDGWQFDYQTYREPKSNKTIVLLPSAQSKAKRRFPYYSRGLWAPDFKCNIIVVSDPTLQLNLSLLGGWFQGVNANWVLPLVLAHIDRFLSEWGQKWEDCCFYGSSLGGFAALQAICYHPQAKAFVEIPQIDLREYTDPSMRDLAQLCYGEQAVKNVDDRYSNRISVIETIRATQEIGRFFYFQKLNDRHHFDKHFSPFSQFLQSEGKQYAKSGYMLEVGDMSGQNSMGHSPLEKFEAIRLISFFLDL